MRSSPDSPEHLGLACLGGCATLLVLMALMIVFSGAMVWAGSWALTVAFSQIPRLDFTQSLCVGFVLTFVIAPIFRDFSMRRHE